MKLVYTNSDGEVIREIKMTNFDEITSSPEALAEFISDTCCMLLQEVHVDGGCINGEYDETKTEKWLEWLKQESNNE